MKKNKVIIFCIVAFLFLYLAFKKTDPIYIYGDWSATKIVLDGKELYPLKKKRLFNFNPIIKITRWKDSLYIFNKKEVLKAHFIFKKKDKSNYIAKLTSPEKSLNGIFELTIDTIHINSTEYKVEAKLTSKNTSIHFVRNVILKPWKPELPRRGNV